jgi:Tol biopolymer transport system component
VFFSSMRSGQGDLYQRPSSPAGAEQMILQSPDQKCAMSVSSDGKFMLLGNLSPKTKDDLWILPLSGERKPTPFLQTPFRELGGQFSPDGKWVAYASDESGRSEIYLQSFSDPSLRFQVSAGGGFRPRWRADGRELFYFGGGEILSVAIGTETPLQPGTPKPLFRPPFGVDYAVSRDGQRFLIAAAVEETRQPITVVLHWEAGLGK